MQNEQAKKALAKQIGYDYQGFSFYPHQSVRLYGKHASIKQNNDQTRFRNRLHLNELAPYRLVVKECISTGRGKWSQVYRCALQGQGLPVDATVILKLYQQSLFVTPEEEHFYPWMDFDFAQHWQPAEFFAKRESFAYQALAEEQGRLIPWCYGFYQFDLPCGEQVEGVILEYVTGDSLPDYIEEHIETLPATKADLPLIRSAIVTVLRAYLRLLEFGVAHGDGGEGNIIINPGSSVLDFSVIVLDFGLAMGKDFCKSGTSLSTYTRQAYRYLRKSFESLVPDAVTNSIFMNNR